MTLWLIVAGIIAVGVIGVFVRKSGSDSVKAQVGEQNAKVAEKVAAAVGNAPTTRDELVERLRKDGGKL